MIEQPDRFFSQRESMVLRAIHRSPSAKHKDIAQQIGCSPSVVCVALKRIRTKILQLDLSELFFDGETKTTKKSEAPKSWEDLPNKWLPDCSSVADVDPAALQRMVDKPDKILPIPEKELPPGPAAGRRNLVQYRGHKSKAGKARSLANLRRTIVSTDPTPPIIDPSLPKPPDVPLPDKSPDDIPLVSGTRGKYVRTILSKAEYGLFMELWIEIFKAHKDEYTMPEDHMDVMDICLERVLQMRMLQLQAVKPKEYNADHYNQSVRRMNKARENLMARRSDRDGNKKGRGDLNLAVIVGNVDQKGFLEGKQQVILEQQGEEMAFLENTGHTSTEDADALVEQAKAPNPPDDKEQPDE